MKNAMSLEAVLVPQKRLIKEDAVLLRVYSSWVRRGLAFPDSRSKELCNSKGRIKQTVEENV